MSNPWHDLLLKLGSLENPVFAYWSMSNGSKFLFAVPRAASIRDDSFSDDVEFPFTFSEIFSLDIPRQIGTGAFAIGNNLEGIHETISSVPGLDITFTKERLAIAIAASG